VEVKVKRNKMGKLFTKEETERLLKLSKEDLNKLKRKSHNRGYLFDEKTNDKLAAVEKLNNKKGELKCVMQVIKVR